MNHRTPDCEASGLAPRLLGRRAFNRARAAFVAAAALAAFLTAWCGPGLVASAGAQTMGEYGGITAGAGQRAAGMPHANPPSLMGRVRASRARVSTVGGGGSGVKTYEVSPDRGGGDRNDRDGADDSGDSAGEWQQVN